jgi:hypothetical protein
MIEHWNNISNDKEKKRKKREGDFDKAKEV